MTFYRKRLSSWKSIAKMKLIKPLEKIMSHHEFFADWERELLNFLNFTYFHLIFTGVGLME